MSSNRIYSKNWFNPEPFKILNEFKNLNDINFLEIGSFEGLSTNFFIDNYLTGNNCFITCIDPWIEYSRSTVGNIQGWDDLINDQTYERFCSNTIDNRDKIIIHRNLSKNILPSLSCIYNFIYIDGDHTTSSVLYDAVYGFQILLKNGIMIFDDYDWSYATESPKIAIDLFLSDYKDSIDIISIDSQVVIKKRI